MLSGDSHKHPLTLKATHESILSSIYSSFKDNFMTGINWRQNTVCARDHGLCRQRYQNKFFCCFLAFPHSSVVDLTT
jgi:hypothetical protein